ncbi:MAG: OmpA family protein [Candidatus Omnitrophica bacterium]|nr:OmpA family protein [Candidatus Omnitrophota bacterium]
MSKKDRKETSVSQRGAPAWLLTYGDLMTLLLTFFVLLLSFSNVEVGKFKQAVGSLNSALGLLGKHQYLISLGKILVPEAQYSYIATKMQQTTGDISKTLNFVSQYENVEIQEDVRGLNIILPAEILFESGNDVVKVAAYPLLKKIGAFLYEQKEDDSMFVIEGHTDNRPVHTIRFPSNWHLSSARAISIARFFNEQCIIANVRMSVCGYAEFQPVAPNDTEENRAKNRRVIISIQRR